MAAVWRWPAAPLHAVDRAEVSHLVGPLVPDRDPVLLQRADVPFAAQEPEQLLRDGREVHPLRRHEREALGQVEPHLAPEDAHGPRPGAVRLRRAACEDVAHEVLVLGADRTLGHDPTDDSAVTGGGRQVVRSVASEPCFTTTHESYSSSRYGAFSGTTVTPSFSAAKRPH